MGLAEQTPEAREAARQKALVVRRERAILKERVKMGVVSFPEVLAEAETDPGVGKIKVLSLLEAVPGVGKVKARRLLEEIGIAENRRLQGLGPNQRTALLEHFG